jgi:hypothetical protein
MPTPHWNQPPEKPVLPSCPSYFKKCVFIVQGSFALASQTCICHALHALVRLTCLVTYFFSFFNLNLLAYDCCTGGTLWHLQKCFHYILVRWPLTYLSPSPCSYFSSFYNNPGGNWGWRSWNWPEIRLCKWPSSASSPMAQLPTHLLLGFHSKSGRNYCVLPILHLRKLQFALTFWNYCKEKASVAQFWSCWFEFLTVWA